MTFWQQSPGSRIVCDITAFFQPSLRVRSCGFSSPEIKVLWVPLSLDQYRYHLTSWSSVGTPLTMKDPHSACTMFLCQLKQLSHACNCNLHIFFLYILDVRAKVSVQTRFTQHPCNWPLHGVPYSTLHIYNISTSGSRSENAHYVWPWWQTSTGHMQTWIESVIERRWFLWD